MRDVSGLEIPRSILVNALHTAADKYLECARTCKADPKSSGLEGVFRQQSATVLRYADVIEQAPDDARILLIG